MRSLSGRGTILLYCFPMFCLAKSKSLGFLILPLLIKICFNGSTFVHLRQPQRRQLLQLPAFPWNQRFQTSFARVTLLWVCPNVSHSEMRKSCCQRVATAFWIPIDYHSNESTLTCICHAFDGNHRTKHANHVTLNNVEFAFWTVFVPASLAPVIWPSFRMIS